MAGLAADMREKARTAILISGRGSNMEALVKSTQEASSPAQIAVVISNQRNAQGLKIAQMLGVEAMCIDHKNYSAREDFEAELDRQCRARAIGLVLCAGFMRVMTSDFVARWHGRMVNIHPSLLPCYPGLHTHERALKDQVKIHGCTVHFVTAEIDRGPIIAQAAVPVMPGDTEETLAKRVLAQEHRLYPMVLRWLAAGLVRLEGDKVVYDFESAGEEASLSVPLMAKS
jgi:phosphoribosylglycinamide formyltransferase 1